MKQLIEALDLALETLESIQAVYPCETVGKRITAIKQARSALEWNAEDQDHYKQTNEAMTPEQTLDWLAEQHKSQCNEERPVQEWIRSMKSMLPAHVQEPVAWMYWLNGPCRVWMNKDEAMMELDRLNREYPVDGHARKVRPLVFGDTTPPAAKRQWVGLDWLPEHKCGLHLSHNEHRDVYETVEQFYDADDFTSKEEWHKAVAEDSVWVLHWYPNTPVGFTRIAASTLEAIEAKLKEKNT
jgi:hypothetical protein